MTNKELEDTAALVEKYNIYAIWIAATDIGHEGTFVWATNGQKVVDYHWQPGNPNNYQDLQDCVYMRDGMWNDVTCSLEYVYFCEETGEAVRNFDGNFKLAEEDAMISV